MDARKAEEQAEFEKQMLIAEQAMDRYRHALRALATGQTLDEVREQMAREEITRRSD